MDFLDILDVKTNEVFKGKYYKDRPETPADFATEFTYDVVDANDRTYSKVLNNLEVDRGTHSIKTNEYLDFKINAYVITQDGLMWQITSVQTIPSKNKQAYRYIKRAVGEEYVLRLIQVDNPWGLK